MVDLLITALLVGAAISALIELLDMVLEILVWNISKSALKKVLVLPLSVLGSFLMGVWSAKTAVVSLAALLVSLSITLWLDKPVVISNTPKGRSTLGGLGL